jgi:DNA polymerase I-like protein with 3'-5' exonuclease and polymerase domains
MRTCYVAFDTETYRIVLGRLAPPPVVLTYATSNGTERAVTPDEGARLLRSWCEDPNTIIVGHNVAFDMGVMLGAYPELVEPIFEAYAAGRVRDTSIREKLIRLASGEMSSDFGAGRKMTSFSMEAIFKVRFNEDLSALKQGDGAWRLNYHRLDGVPLEAWPKEALDYAMGDATRTLRLFHAQGEDDSLVVDQATGAVTNEQEQVAAAIALHLAGVWGIRTDPHAVAELARRLDEEAVAHERAMREAGVLRADGTKDLKRVKALVEECLGDNAPRTEKGAISTDRECLMRTGHPALKAVAELGAIDKLRKTYVPMLLQGTEVPINPAWNVLVESGRTSAREPNLQNLPRKGGVRECFVPRKGRIFASADYSTLELCTLAQVCLDLFGHSAMAEALHAGRDLHLQMAASILGVDYDEVLARHKAKDPQVKEMRQLAKAANFGYPGGLGAASFQTYAAATYNVTVSEDESRQLKAQWLEAWPEMRAFFDHVGGQLQMRDAFDLVQPRSGRIRGQVGYCDGCNSHFQGLAADGAKAAMFLLQQECYTGKSELWKGEGASPLYGCRMVAFIHDEFVLEVPEALPLAQAAVARLVEVMVEGMALYVPDVPIKAEPTLMRRWYKEAEPVWDADGKLLVWEPKEKA